MTVKDIINFLEQIAPPSLQEHYDNSGLILGSPEMECKGVLVALDSTEEIVKEAIARQCNLIVVHHPIIFGGLKKINPSGYVGRAVITAIKNDIAIYAIHTNLDNVLHGVNGKMASMLNLQKTSVLSTRAGAISQLVTYVPTNHLDAVRNALFAAGAGHIGNYDEAAFSNEGTGSFRAMAGANPFVGQMGERHYEKEIRLEMVFPSANQATVIQALKLAHPYEEVAYNVTILANQNPQIGSGLIGELPEEMDEISFLQWVCKQFHIKVLRHTALRGRKVKRVALCGGAGSFLIPRALAAGADVFLTADLKYHEFFDANGKLILADLGHFESEQCTIHLLFDLLQEKFTNFAVLKTGLVTNPVHYLI